ncbi:conserved exported hypothetical protein [Verrucomicrobia bacterium]|nr:conserved exported hypothetical protein [Verrucomicrobiota bacterium]
MNRKQLIILLVLVAVVGGAGLMIYNKQNADRQSGNRSLGKKLLADLPINDVGHIAIRQGGRELNLVKKEDWLVKERNNYPANYSQIRDLLIKLQDLKIVQSETVGPSQLPRLALVPGTASNAATVVDFKDQNDKTLKSLLLGKEHTKKSNRPSPMGMGEMGEDGGWPDGRYVKVGADSASVALVSDPLSNVEPKPEAWLDKDFFKVEKVRSIAVAFPVATNSWKVTRETESGEWKLADAKPGEQLDSTKTSSLSNPLNSPSFNDVEADTKPEALANDKATVMTLGTFDNFTYTIKVGQKTNDTYPLAMSVAADLPKERTPGKDEKAEDKAKLDKEFKDNQKKLEDKLAQEKAYEKWVYLVSSWTVDPVLKERSQLLVEKKEEKKDEKKEEKAAAAPKKEETASQATDPKPADDPPPAKEP